MHTLRTKITLVAVCIIVLAVSIVTLFSVLFIKNTERQKSDQLLLLLCETGERNLDYYFKGVEESVEKVASFVEEDLKGLEKEQLSEHLEHAGKYFEQMAYRTNGVLTYYYRIDPEISDSEKGFWYTDMDGEGFVEHEVTDITLYDTSDTSKLVWFTVPKSTGKAIWLPPYITDNLDVRVISYNVPIYFKDKFVGVVGIEIDYSTMAEQVDSIRLYNNGYAFITDAEGNLIYHPRIDVTELTEETRPAVPEGLVSSNTFVTYKFEGVEKEAAWLKLANGMRFYVSVPKSETAGDWQELIEWILLTSAVVLGVLSLFTLFYVGNITKQLQDITEVAEQMDQGNFEFLADYSGDEDMEELTKPFKQLAGQMKDHISEMNKQLYVDALTSVRNKGAFYEYLEELQGQLDKKDIPAETAIIILSCDNLKQINSQYGHDKGDIYLKTASSTICGIFKHSPVFRIGIDEFSVVLQNEDFQKREERIKEFEDAMERSRNEAKDPWEEVHVSLGLAVYDPHEDAALVDTVRRADKQMYMDKREKNVNQL